MTRPVLKILVILLAWFFFSGQLFAQTPFVVVPGVSGNWYDKSHNGEGVQIEVLDADRAIITWYTYNGVGEQVWIFGVGRISGNRIVVDDALISSGGVFGPLFNPDDVQFDSWGNFEIEFASCDAATLNYTGPSGFGSGTLNLEQLAGIHDLPCDQSRPFLLGFTTFPYEVSSAGLDEAYRIIKDHGDLAVIHFDNGVPWPEALAGDYEAYPTPLKNEWQSQKDRSLAGYSLLLAMTPIHILRNGLAPYSGPDGVVPLTDLGAPWVSAGFDHADVKQAYLNHVINAIEFYDPDYLLMGIEVNLLRKLRPDLWPGYVALQAETFAAIRARYPALPLMLSFTAADMLPGYSDAHVPSQIDALRDVEDYTDYFGVSFYPHLTPFLTNPLPDDTYQQIDALSDKPIAITETGFYSEQAVFDFGGGMVTYEGTQEKQRDWLNQLLSEAERRQFRFVVNFVSRDYDALCVTIQCSDLERVWEATGFYDPEGNAKLALSVWEAYRQRAISR